MPFRIVVIVLAVGAVGVYVVNPYDAPNWHPMARLVGQQLFRMPNAAMEPSIQEDTYFRGCFGDLDADPKVGDAVLFLTPDEPPLLQVKRVAAIGGTVVELEESIVKIDGVPVGNWSRPSSSANDYVRHMNPVQVPIGFVFLLGDNLERSRDSRFFGPIPAENIVGRPCEPI